MNSQKPGKNYLEELGEFLTFLKNLWGILAGISVFFPLSNVLLGVIPLQAYGTDGGVYDQLSPNLISTTATIVTLFVVLVTFAQRSRFRNTSKRSALLRTACISFGSGILVLLAYLVLHQAYAEYAWEPWGWGSGDPRKLLVEIPLLLSYVAFFSLVTRAFMLLGMIEYFGKRTDRPKPGGKST